MNNLKIDYKTDFPLIAIRLILGLILTLHGAQKVFGVFGGSGLDGWNKYITSQNMIIFNINYPDWLATLAAWLELLAGIAIILGIGTKIAAAIMFVFLLFAIKIAHRDKGFFVSNGGYEYCLVLLVLCSILVVSGGGKYQLYPLFDN